MPLAAMLRSLVACLFVVAGTASAAPQQPPLPGSDGPVPLGPYFEKLVDRDAKLSIEEVRSGLRDAEFQRNHEVVPNLGMTTSALWLRFRPPRDLPPGDELLLEIRWPLLDRIEFYAPQPAGPDWSAAGLATSRWLHLPSLPRKSPSR